MTDPDGMDLTALDPGRDPERWARRVDATRLLVDAVLAGRLAPSGSLDMVGAWFRPILAAAAVLVALLGAAGVVLGGRSTPLDRASEARRLAVLSDNSLGRGERPTGAQLLVAIRSRRAP
jgi:hypothetical protein